MSAEINYKAYNPDLRSDNCKRQDLQSKKYKINLKKVQAAELHYYKESYSGPEIMLKCASDDCITSTNAYTQGCEENYQAKADYNMSISFSNTSLNP